MSAVHPGFSKGISEIHNITVQYRAVIYVTLGLCYVGLLPCISFLHQVNCFGAFFLLRATTHPLCPENSEHVRVQSYNSRMVILPHRTFDEVRVFFQPYFSIFSARNWLFGLVLRRTSWIKIYWSISKTTDHSYHFQFFFGCMLFFSAKYGPLKQKAFIFYPKVHFVSSRTQTFIWQDDA